MHSFVLRTAPSIRAPSFHLVVKIYDFINNYFIHNTLNFIVRTLPTFIRDDPWLIILLEYRGMDDQPEDSLIPAYELLLTLSGSSAVFLVHFRLKGR
jgi:hypothetical protein